MRPRRSPTCLSPKLPTVLKFILVQLCSAVLSLLGADVPNALTQLGRSYPCESFDVDALGVRDAWMDANRGSVSWCLSGCAKFVASVRLQPWALVVWASRWSVGVLHVLDR